MASPSSQESFLSNNGRTAEAIELLKRQLAEIEEERSRVIAALKLYGYAAPSSTFSGLDANEAITRYLEQHDGKSEVEKLIEDCIAGGFGVQLQRPAAELKKSLAMFDSYTWVVTRKGPRRRAEEVVEADFVKLLPVEQRRALKRRKRRK